MKINPNLRLCCLQNDNYLFPNYSGKYFTQKSIITNDKQSKLICNFKFKNKISADLKKSESKLFFKDQQYNLLREEAEYIKKIQQIKSRLINAIKKNHQQFLTTKNKIHSQSVLNSRIKMKNKSSQLSKTKTKSNSINFIKSTIKLEEVCMQVRRRNQQKIKQNLLKTQKELINQQINPYKIRMNLYKQKTKRREQIRIIFQSNNKHQLKRKAIENKKKNQLVYSHEGLVKSVKMPKLQQLSHQKRSSHPQSKIFCKSQDSRSKNLALAIPRNKIQINFLREIPIPHKRLKISQRIRQSIPCEPMSDEESNRSFRFQSQKKILSVRYKTQLCPAFLQTDKLDSTQNQNPEEILISTDLKSNIKNKRKLKPTLSYEPDGLLKGWQSAFEKNDPFQGFQEKGFSQRD